ncbi:MAG: sulfatase-like hydrolase/transferase [Anaerocolumna sp.]
MNYVLFFPDELRAESLGCYGNTKINTPNFERLAREGVLFEQCHVQNPVCSPSRCSLFTGQYVHVNGHRTLWNLIKPYEKNLFRYFKEAGYEVRIYGKNDLFSEGAIPHSVDEFMNKPGLNRGKHSPVKEFGESGYYDFLYKPLDGDYTEHSDYQNVEAGINFIKSWKKGDKPFVLFLPLLSPHCPYTIQEPFYSMYKEDDIRPLRESGVNKPEYYELIRQYRDLSATDFKKIQAVYMGMATFTDALLGHLMDSIREAGIENDTMLIAASDHGDYAGDYNLVEKWPNACEDVLTRVPLIIKGPGYHAGHRIKEQVELFDIMPTMMEDANIPIRHTCFAHSLVPQLKGAAGDPDRAVFCEGGYNPNEKHCNEGYPKEGTAFMSDKHTIYYPKGLQQFEHPGSVARTSMIRTLEYKLVMRSLGKSELYDLRKDPKELVNLSDNREYETIKKSLELRLLNWYIETSDVVPFEEDLRDLR